MLCLSCSINAKMPTIVGILTFTSRINFMLSSVEYETSFITSGPDCMLGKFACFLLSVDFFNVYFFLKEKEYFLNVKHFRSRSGPKASRYCISRQLSTDR